MRSILFCLPLVFAAEAAAQTTTCGEAARNAAPDAWDPASFVSGDFTLDGKPDVAFWKREDHSVMLYIAACDGERATETWRFRIALADAIANEATVEATTPLMDASLVARVCAAHDNDECKHMKAENERRQVIAAAGGRELRIGVPDNGVRVRWSSEHHGFMRIGG